MVNIQKSITFMYTNNEQVEFEIKSTILFILAPKKKLRQNLTKYVLDLYDENDKMLEERSQKKVK